MNLGPRTFRCANCNEIFGWAYWAFVVTFWVGVFLLVRWQLKFANLLTNDTDYPAAKRSKNISALMILGALPLGLILNPFLGAHF